MTNTGDLKEEEDHVVETLLAKSNTTPDTEDVTRSKSSDQSDDDSDRHDENDTQHTKKKSCFHSIGLFVLVLPLLNLFRMTMVVYHNGVSRTIERRFGLTSTQTAIIGMFNDIVQIPLVLVIGYVGRSAHQPRIIAVTSLFYSVGGLFMVSPMFFTSLIDDDILPMMPQTNMTLEANSTFTLDMMEKPLDKGLLLCDLNKQMWGNNSTTCSVSKGESAGTNRLVYVMFCLANFWWGVAGFSIYTVGMSYISTNAPQHRASLYVGILTSTFVLGPVCGLLLASFSTRLPENLTESSLSPDHPAFIGCWWLGFAITSVLVVLMCIPIFFFPKHIKPPPPTEEKNLTKDKSSLKDRFKEFWEATRKLLGNGRFLTLMTADVCQVYLLMGIIINQSRYMESHFLLPAYKATILTAIFSAGCGVFGALAGGIVVARLRLNQLGLGKYITGASLVCLAAIVCGIFLRCPKLTIVGEKDPSKQLFSLTTGCNQNCSCAANRQSYQPVCGADNLTYFSPCHAGCPEKTNGTTFTDCSCVAGTDNTASAGYCLSACDMIYPYIVVSAILSIASASGRPAETVAVMRVVPEKERSFALGLDSFMMNVLGFLPAPVIVGKLIDTACSLWQYECEEKKNCLLYDMDTFRYLLYGLALLFAIASLTAHIVYCILAKRHVAKSAEESIKGFPMTIKSTDHSEEKNR